MRSLAAMLALAAGVAAGPLAAADTDRAQIARIVDEGTNHSQLAETAEYLDDRIGGRLTNSPALHEAEQWTQGRYRDWGLTNIHLEPFEFGRGWSIDHVSVRMTAPRALQLRAIPVAWTPATAGPVTAPIIVAPLARESDFVDWRGKLAGKIVLVTRPKDPADATDAPFQRLKDDDLAKLDKYQEPDNDPAALERIARMTAFGRKLDAFLKAEGAVAWVRCAYRDGGLVTGEGYLNATGGQVPGIELAAEDYRRLARLAKLGPVSLEVDSAVRFHDESRQAANVIAEIPGSDPKAGYVMAGAHLDSWVAADGAADNGAGSAMVMEAARILAALHVRPKRTIRFALWEGEEQGLYGSIAYVERNLASRPPGPADETGLARYMAYAHRFPIVKKPGYDQLAAYFNIDNGSGKLRGIFAENNFAAEPILQQMLAPFDSMGASKVVVQATDGTDHQFMAALGLPAFQFIQDPLDYETVVHHSSVDTYDHLRLADMRQGAVILASMLLQAADRAEPLPRAPLPTAPRPTDPFAYPEKPE